MNKKRTRDIYETAETARRRKVALQDQPNPTESDPWYEFFLRSRRSFVIFRLVLLAFLITIGMVLVEQFRSSARRWSGRQPIEMEVNIRSDPIFNVDEDIRMQFVMDELNSLDTALVPKEESPPLNTHWLKQAAYYLLQAENAYQQEDWERASEYYEIVEQIHEGVIGVDAQLGLCYMRLRRFEDSEQAFEQALAMETNSFRVINNLGVAKLSNQKFEEAEDLFQQALLLNHDYGPAILNLALLYYKTDRMKEAAERFGEYFKISPANLEAVQAYVLALIELNRWEEAAELLVATSKLRPEAAPIQFRLAQVLSNTDNPEGALQALRRGISLLDSRKALAMLAKYDYDKLRNLPEFKQIVSELTYRED